jgi:hypothetical protein
MNRAILLLLWSAAAASAQNAGASARVAVEKLPVYAKMKAEGEPAKMLFKGDAVIIGLVLFGDDITWCAVTKVGETRRLGYVACESLEPDRAGTISAPTESPAATPAEPPPLPPKKTMEPIRIREVPTTPVKVRELSRHTADELLKNARASGAIPDPAGLKPPEPLPVPEAPPPAPEPAPKTEPPANLAETSVNFALDRGGISREITMYVQRTNLMSFLDRNRLAKIDQNLLKQVVASHFQPKGIEQAVTAKLAASYNPSLMPKLMVWLRSENTEKVEAALENASREEARRDLVTFAGKITENPPPRERLLLIHRLYDATLSAEREVGTTMTLVRALASAMNPLLPKDLRFQAADLDQSLKTVEAKYLPVMKNARMVHLLFAFRHLPDSDLEPYVLFWESETGKWLTRNIDAGYSEAGGQISGRLIQDLPGRIRNQH